MAERLWTLEEYATLPALVLKIQMVNLTVKEGDYRILSYGKSPRQAALLFEPNKPKDKLIYFLHGGGWMRGKAYVFRFVGKYFSELGYTTALGGYRWAPRTKFPGQADDAAKGLAKVMKEWDGDVVVVGQSAGAQLAGLLTYDRELQEKYGIQQERIKGLLSISGPLDMQACRNPYFDKMMRHYLKDIKDLDKASPINYVQGDEGIPVLCVHGDEDPTVNIQGSRNFVEKVNEKQDGLAELITVRSAHHAEVVKVFLGEMAETEKMEKWLGCL